MNKNPILALFLMGLIVGTIGAALVNQASQSPADEPLFVG
jgi:hypothetical protein